MFTSQFHKCFKVVWISFILWWDVGSLLQGAEGILDYNRFMSEIEPLLLTKEYLSPGPTPMTCFACHGNSSHAAYRAFPLWRGQPRNNFSEVGRRVKVSAPDTSLLLLKPLALAAGGVPHGLSGNDAGEQFANTTADENYRAILTWIVDATRASVGARVTRTEPYPNPFRTTTNIVYFLTTPANSVDIKIFTSSGHHIKSFIGSTRVGANHITWDGRDEDNEVLPTGLYFYVVKALFEDDTSVIKGRCVFTP